MKRPYNIRATIRTAAAVLLLCAPAKAMAQEAKPFAPKLFGVLKTRFETDTQTGDLRFNINNARLGVKGEAGGTAGLFRYQFQADLNSEGKLSILDTYVAFASGAFEVSLGQQLYHFGTELSRGPGKNYFASSSFLTTYVGSYYTERNDKIPAAAGNLGARDIGILFTYKGTEQFPVGILAGLVNGYGINNMAWHRNVNFVARLWIDPGQIVDGFGIAGNYYTGKTPLGNDITIAGGELRYMKERWIIEPLAGNRQRHRPAGPGGRSRHLPPTRPAMGPREIHRSDDTLGLRPQHRPARPIRHPAPERPANNGRPHDRICKKVVAV